ncbi:T9SS type A sorting domain-containing protein [bacterium]|nr:T9SS type A sorting domain-containing protein [bacterium]MBU1652875.1 T9SS type A sorting domain-containing protein [bacterium]
MSRLCAILLMASLLLTLPVSAAEVTVQRTVPTPEISAVDGFHHFTKVAGSLYSPPGYPELPNVGHQLLLPPGEEAVNVTLANEIWQTLPGIYNLFPAQPPVPLSRAGEQPFTEADPAIYGIDGFYPESPVQTYRTDFLSGHGITSTAVTTARYNPVSGMLEVLTSYELTVETASSARAQESFDHLYKSTLSVNDRIGKKVENIADLSAYPAPDEVDDFNAKYLIITVEELVDAIQPLAEHRTNRGMQSEIVLISDIEASYPGVDLAEKIRVCIIDYYMYGSLEYVLLCGDVEHVPTRGLWAAVGGEIDNDVAADLYFSNLDGNWNADGDNSWGEPNEADLYAELAIGRFAVDDYGECYTMVYKTMMYENSPVLGDIEKALFLGEDLGWLAWGGEYQDEVRYGSSNYGYTTAGCAPNFITSEHYDMYGVWSAMGDLLPSLNAGTHLVSHLGHSNTNYTMKFSTGSVTPFNMTNDGIDEGFYIMYSQGCYGGSYDNRTTGGSYTSDCICEAFTTITTGAVAFLCNSRYGWGSYNNTNGASQYYNRQFFDALFAENITKIGWTNADSKEDCIPFLGSATYWVYYEMNLLGDPALDIWTGQPMTFAPTYPDTVLLGTTQLTVDVGVAGAYIVLIDDDEVLGYATSNPTGSATMFLMQPISTPGTLTLSIMSHNYYPYTGSIEAVTAEGPYIIIGETTFDDTQSGNGDGIADLGETLMIDTEFENVGIEDAIGVTATISINETCVNIVDNVVDLGDLTVGESISVEDAFEIMLLPTVSDGQELTFNIEVTDAQNNIWSGDYTITAYAPELEMLSYTLDDGNDGKLFPGETATLEFEIQNVGGGATTEMEVTLLSDNPLVTINTFPIVQSAILSGETTTAAGFEFSIDAGAADPSAIVLYLHAVDTRTYQDNFLIELSIGGEFDDMEAGAGDWTHEAVTPGLFDQWNHSQIMNHTPGGANAWYCGDMAQYMTFLDAGLLTPEFEIYGRHQLRFYHWMSAELASGFLGYAYDGGIVEMSLNGGLFQQITSVDGYPVKIRHSAQPCVLAPETPCYSGQILWDQEIFAIEGAGTVQFRFRFASDGQISSIGWFIDDLELVMESTMNAPTNLLAEQNNDDILLTWNTPSLPGTLQGFLKPGERGVDALEYYRLYRDGSFIDSIAALSYVDNVCNQPYGTFTYQVSGVFDGEESALSEPFTVDYVGVRPEVTVQMPTETALHSAYPNPFNPAVNLRIDLIQSQKVTVRVYDLMGRVVADLADGTLSAGSHVLNWNASGMASGMYLVQMETDSYVGIQKVLLLK